MEEKQAPNDYVFSAPAPPVVVIDHAGTAEAACDALRQDGRLMAVTAPGAAKHAGPYYLWEMVRPLREAGYTERLVLDCGDNAALVQLGLRLGWRRFLFTGAPAMRGQLAQLLTTCNAHFIDKGSKPVTGDK